MNLQLVWKTLIETASWIQAGGIENNWQRETAITIEETQCRTVDKSHNGILLFARARSLIIQERSHALTESR